VNATLTDRHLAQLRTAGLALPRAPYPGQEWKPRTAAEEHLLGEGHRLDRLRLVLLEEVGRLRGRTVRAERAEVTAAAVRTADRMSKCPLTTAQFTVVEAAAAGEPLEDTARRLFLSYEAIKTNRRRAVDRLQARDMTHAVALALAHGWLLPGGVLAGSGEAR
jgi:DNA-binding CsgD family transcriptional regulator